MAGEKSKLVGDPLGRIGVELDNLSSVSEVAI
jgi:hypothetical protein